MRHNMPQHLAAVICPPLRCTNGRNGVPSAGHYRTYAYLTAKLKKNQAVSSFLDTSGGTHRVRSPLYLAT